MAFSSVVAALLFVAANADMKEITDVPGLGAPPTKNYAGHITVNTTCEAKLFFWLVESESNPKTDPLVIWFNGCVRALYLYGHIIYSLLPEDQVPPLFSASS